MDIFLLLLVAGWMAWLFISDKITDRREARRNAQKVALRRQILGNNPDSGAAYESLGDAMRTAGEYTDALVCYEKAIDLANARPSRASGSGYVGGAGLETKLRLVRLEVSERDDPDKHGVSMRTRQQICRQCGQLGMPWDKYCGNCNGPLPVDTMLDTLHNVDMRQAIIRETVQVVIMLLIVVIACFVISTLPLLLRVTVCVAAILVIPFRLLKHFTI